MEKEDKQPKLEANSAKPRVRPDEEPLYRPYSKKFNSVDNNAGRNLSNIRLQALIFDLRKWLYISLWGSTSASGFRDEEKDDQTGDKHRQKEGQ